MLPTSLAQGQAYYKNFTQFDVILVSGDPYYDHPLSGTALLARLVESKGYSVGIISQPQTDDEYQSCGLARYFYCLTSGLLDSMLANYTPMLHPRENVEVPERALMVYTQKIKQFFPGSITVLGGVEATIRRFTHFDYKTNALRRGILNDTKADLLLFSNADRTILELLERLKGFEGKSFPEVKEHLNLPSLDGAAFRIKKAEIKWRILPSFEECVADSEKFNLLTRINYLLPDDAFVEPCGLGFIQHNRPAHPLIEEEMDYVYELPFTRKLDPKSKNFEFNQGMVQKLEHSVILGRGCWGGCYFCVIPLVQGKDIARRSPASILKEIEFLYQNGIQTISDLTLPTLNMYGSHCDLYNVPQQIFSPIIKKEITVFNKDKYCNQNCVGCPQRVISDDLYPLLKDVEKLQQKYSGTSLELRSAVRHDIILNQKKLFRQIMQFTSRLKIAPEHVVDSVLKQMNKATAQDFLLFLEEYKKINEEQGTDKNLVPYFVAAHPGSTLKDMEILQQFCEEKDIYVNLTQVFTPTPGTVSTATYYSGRNPFTGEKVYVPRRFREKKDQKSLLLNKC